MCIDILINHAIVIQKKMNQAKSMNQNVVNNLVHRDFFFFLLISLWFYLNV